MRICLIGITHPCHNPRLIREADSLVEAGHQVRVVAPCFMPEMEEKDQRLIARRKWSLERVDFRPIGWRGRFRALKTRGRRRVYKKYFGFSRSLRTAKKAYTLAYPELLKLALSERANWFIAHTQGALPIAAKAAKHWKAHLGFDCEDLLSEHDPSDSELIGLIERKYLPLCDYVSVPSQCIANKLVKDYSIDNPLVLYNVFPLYLADGMIPPMKRPIKSKLRLHWFGQVIGPGRGIEEAIEAVGLLGEAVELHLRGYISEGYKEILHTLAHRYKVALRLWPQVDHDDLIRTMEQFDVGLALERHEKGNYSQTVSNKVFSYLLAGLAVVATDTPGQREILEQNPSVGFLYTVGNPNTLADGIRHWLNNRNALRVVQQAAWDAARQQFFWDFEKKKFLRIFEGISGDRLL